MTVSKVGCDGSAVRTDVKNTGTSDLLVRVALLVLTVLAVIAALEVGKVILAPIFLSVVVGSILGPIADRMARFGVPLGLSAASMIVSFVLFLLTVGAAFVVPLSGWLDKLPLIWERLQHQFLSWQGFFASIGALQNELQNLIGGAGQVQISVEDTSAVESVFYFAPTFMAQVILFLASLYFFILTRPALRKSALGLPSNSEGRHGVSSAVRAIEGRLSRYLLSITLINFGLGVSVSALMWVLDVPSPLLWGMLAGGLNYIIYIGPAIMVAVMTGVGLATGATPFAIVTPPLAYLCLNLIEAQFVTPTILGRTMTINPFLVFLSIAFWIWLWGPIGGFVAVPVLLVGISLAEFLSERGSW